MGLVLCDVHKYPDADGAFDDALAFKPGDSWALNLKHYVALKADLT
ncbi:MAG: hypothetical protein WCF90_00590 [Methanomicrobiales archaeon]